MSAVDDFLEAVVRVLREVEAQLRLALATEKGNTMADEDTPNEEKPIQDDPAVEEKLTEDAPPETLDDALRSAGLSALPDGSTEQSSESEGEVPVDAAGNPTR